MLHKKGKKSMDRRPFIARCLLNRLFVCSVLLLSIPALMTGCSLAYPNRHIETSADYNLLAGYALCTSSRPGTIVVAAYEENDGNVNIADYTIVHESGPYELVVPQDQPQILAFSDENNDLVLEEGEPAVNLGADLPAWLKVDGMTITPEIVIAGENERAAGGPVGFKVSKDKPKNLRSRTTGEIADLNDAIFAERYGAQGYWAPRTFLKNIGANIFFLEDYNPKKTPVLFIHGATGSPRGWHSFIESMNKARFQPWFFYYPSGAPVKSMSNLLFWNLLKLRRMYHFDSIFIIAHSMGGLVARSFIMDFGDRFPFVRLFLSIATPWGGDKLAEYGVQHSPVVVPCWRDLQPDGDLINSLYSRRLPEDIDFYLFFGHKGNRNPFRPNNDRTVSLASLLDLRSQSDASMIVGFNEDHDSILNSKEVLLKYNAIINDKRHQLHWR
jgi:pimeloyl-ACP methyl ester carboxylesterase